MERKTAVLLLLCIAVSIFLGVYGNDWGLPSRWHTDEKVSSVLHMAHLRVLYDPIGIFNRPTGYHIFLLIALAPFYLFLKLFQFPLAEIKAAASVSWIHMAELFPSFANGIYIYARSLSALIGGATVLALFGLGSTLYGKRTGLFAAAFLSVCMGFIGVSHFAKNISLMGLFIVLTLWMAVRASRTTPKKVMPSLYGAFLLAGLAASIHLHGPLLLLPLSIMVLSVRPSLLTLVKSGLLYVLGFILLTPSFLTHFRQYISFFSYKYSTQLLETPTQESSAWFVGPLNNLFEILSIYGLPLFILVALGLIGTLLQGRKTERGEIIVLSFIVSFFIIMSCFFSDTYPQVKHVIAIVPLLALFAAKTMERFFSSARPSLWIKRTCFGLIFTFSFVYSFQGAALFHHGDTRHASTAWILSHVPAHATIEVFDQLNYVSSTSLMNQYNIVYLGQSSEGFQGKHFFKWNTVENRETYLDKINRTDSTSDFILIDINDLSKLDNPAYMDHIPGVVNFLKTLFENKKHYDIVAVFGPENRKVVSKVIPGWIHFENILWPPIPSYKVTSNTIYIFKRRIADDKV